MGERRVWIGISGAVFSGLRIFNVSDAGMGKVGFRVEGQGMQGTVHVLCLGGSGAGTSWKEAIGGARDGVGSAGVG